MTSERPRGAMATRLDSTKLAAAVAAALGVAPAAVNVPEQVLATNPEGISAILGTEGAGWEEQDGTIDVSYLAGPYAEFDVNVPMEAVHAARTEETVDLADFIRTFGQRLNANHSAWYEFTTGVPAWKARRA